MIKSVSARRGFTLLLALNLFAVLILLGLGACALAVSESVSARHGLELAQARLDAVAAARIALGELQTAAGPDRRATANAVALTDDDEKQPQPWCGVWRTDRLKNEPPEAPAFVHRDAEGALTDDRFTAPERAYDRKAQVLRWLVSGASADPWAAPGADTCELLPAVGDAPAVRVPYESAGDSGRIAWWASDENQKACIGAADTPPGETPATATPTGTAPALIPGWAEDGEPPPAKPLGTGDLVAGGKLTPQAADALAHDLTVDASRVYADALRGGLCRDLTAYITADGDIDGAKAGDPLLCENPDDLVYAKHGPRLGMLRAWAKTGESAVLRPSAGSRHASTGAKSATLFHDGTHPDLPDAAAPTEPVIAPVVTEAAVYRRLSCDPDRRNAAGAPWLRLHLHPRVTLWNPYSKPLAAARYLVHLRVNGSPVFRLVKAGRTITGAITGWRIYNATVNYATTQGTLLFVIDCPELPPGESRLFLPAASAPLYGKSATSGTYDPVANRLVPATTLTNANFHLEDTDAFEDKTLNALAGTDLAGESWRLENSAAEDFAVALKLLAGPVAPTWAGLRAAPTLRYLSASAKCGTGTTPVAGWPAGRAVPLTANTDEAPPADSRDGIRLRRFFETPANRNAYAPAEHMDTAPLADFNPAATLQFIHPLANTTPAPTTATRKSERFGLFVRDEPDPSVDWSALAPCGVTAHPFGPPSAFARVRAVAACHPPAKPGRITALAELGDAPVAPYAWHPASATGDSRLSPFAPAHATAHPRAAESLAGRPAPLTEALRRGEAPESRLLFDLRYELNHALWDRFAPLTGDAMERRAFAANPQANRLPNRHIVPAPDAELTRITGTRAYARAASALMHDAGFNINSTSVTAWKALLAHGRGCSPAGVPGAGAPGKTPYARTPDNPGPQASAATVETDAEAGLGYRSLDDAEIDRLARAIVSEVKRRAPFLGVSDFVNRRLTADPVSTTADAPSLNACGPLQAALDKARINPLTGEPRGLLARDSALPGTGFLAAHQAPSRFEGLDCVITQADLLRHIGHALTARGDSFLVRVAGRRGGAVARAEIRIRRTPAPLRADKDNPDEPDKTSAPGFGRRLEVTGWRWLD